MYEHLEEEAKHFLSIVSSWMPICIHCLTQKAYVPIQSVDTDMRSNR